MQDAYEKFDQDLVVEVEIHALKTADSPRTSGADPEHVEVLAAAQEPLPPIIVHRATMRVIDGLHRLRAAELRGQDKIAARFFDGDEDDAFVLAVESNVRHGLPLTLAERKHAAWRIVASHPQWSDRMIASVSGIAPGTVADIRKRAPGDQVAAVSRIGHDGRVRPVDISEGRLRASELISENPGLSLRQIARAAAISPETVRDVRNRMRRGEDPLPKPRAHKRDEHETRAVERPHDFGTGGTGTVFDQAAARNRATIVERLRADPALRFSETGRTLLRLLNVYTMSAQGWEEIIDNVPPHCGTIVARLANECAGMWEEFAVRLERKVTESA